MQSKIAAALNLKTHPVILTWADKAPEDALRFRPGGWGCVVSLVASAATKGKTVAFDRQTYGCWGGGVGLGFGNQYMAFPGGVDAFCRFLSDGNEQDPQCKLIGQAMAQGPGARLADNFLHGERYLKNQQCARRFLDALPMRDIGDKAVVFKPIERLEANDDVKTVTFFVEPDAFSALVTLANHTQPQNENVGIPWGAGCQVLGIFAYREVESENPKALIGMTDLSARNNSRTALGKYSMSLTIPWIKFLEMENNVEGSFFQRETWPSLQKE